jgi:hypothetical protein
LYFGVVLTLINVVALYSIVYYGSRVDDLLRNLLARLVLFVCVDSQTGQEDL